MQKLLKCIILHGGILLHPTASNCWMLESLSQEVLSLATMTGLVLSVDVDSSMLLLLCPEM